MVQYLRKGFLVDELVESINSDQQLRYNIKEMYLRYWKEDFKSLQRIKTYFSGQKFQENVSLRNAALYVNYI